MPNFAQFETEGYQVIANLLDEAWIQRLKAEQQRFAPKAHSLSVQVQLVHRSATIREFVAQGPQLDIAVQILGPNVCFTHQQYVTKHPDDQHRSNVPWHQDNGYGQLEPPNDLTVWITLDDCDEVNGCLWVIPRSHNGGLLPHHPEHGLMSADIQETGISLPMHAGDAVIFNSLLLHRSLPNTTSAARVAMYVRYCTPDAMMVKEGCSVLDDAYSWMVAGEAN